MTDDSDRDGIGTPVTEPIPIRVRERDGSESTIEVEPGTVLRDALRDAGFEVYGSVSRHANCGGRGICATCGVRVAPDPEPDHWHDAAAARFGYPRLSCRIIVSEPMTVELLEKRLWGQLLPRRSEDA